MKLKNYHFLFFIALFIICSCSKNTPSPTKSNSSTIVYADADIYLAGSSKTSNGDGAATYWKNGTATILQTPTNISGLASTIIVNGSDIYVGGSTEYSAGYGKNNTLIDFDGTMSAMAVSNGDVYTAGIHGNFAAIWVNATLSQLWYTSYSGANAIAINGSDIYATGFITGANNSAVAAYWKNGVVTKLSSATVNANAMAIAVNGTDVYVAGYILDPNNNPTATLWKNGVATTLGGLKSMASIIAINGNDVFIAGDDSGPVYWKNGQKKALPLNSPFAFISSIAFKGTDVFIGGYTNAGPIVWKNDVPTQFTKPDNILLPKSVIVVPH